MGDAGGDQNDRNLTEATPLIGVEAEPGEAILAAPPAIDARIPSSRGRRARWWALALAALAVAAVGAYLLVFVGIVPSVVAAALAAVPLVGTLAAVRAVDREVRQPRSLRVFAVLWGAGVAVLIALGVQVVFVVLDIRPEYELMLIVEAPIVEEVAKGLGVLLVLLCARRAFDGPLDGVVYGSAVGAGFAFSENITYFGEAIADGGAMYAGILFVARGVVTPFAHLMFTAATGFALGLAARRGMRLRGVSAAWVLGLLVAIVLHMVWNASTALGGFAALGLFIVVQVPLFAAFVTVVVLLRRAEASAARGRIAEYAAAGWFTPGEAQMLSTASGRRAAVAWASGFPRDRRRAMRMFIREASVLAAVRQRVVNRRNPLDVADERSHLDRIGAARAELFAT
ncbi:MAG: PrsW family intramembrane metalloprotease [Microbacterium ginsengisoli]|uniref:PrsW family intramembrane metalloprotease n=1 Tax=Microbacterium TaxID=33882 RepID=UPI0009E7394A|nr:MULTISPECIES: PrsW family intramembrane metalloprotease [unclassified Microbacterium]MBN9198923.1 PrsW family intramembrane metalloprotease [Microbacterium ginsengisoli]